MRHDQRGRSLVIEGEEHLEGLAARVDRVRCQRLVNHGQPRMCAHCTCPDTVFAPTDSRNAPRRAAGRMPDPRRPGRAAQRPRADRLRCSEVSSLVHLTIVPVRL